MPVPLGGGLVLPSHTRQIPSCAGACLLDNITQDPRIISGDLPMLAHLLKSRNEERDFGVDFTFHCCSMDQQESS